MKIRIIFLTKIVIFFVVPILLVLLNIIDFKYRFESLVFFTLFVIISSFIEKVSFKDLGITSKNFKKSLWFNIPISVFCIATLLISKKMGLIGREYIPNIPFFIFYVLVSCPSQEFCYRSFLFYQMDKAKINSPFVRIILTALLFGFLHVIYLDWITFAFGVVSGLIWGFIYEKTRNFWGVSLSHVIFGGVTILAGLI